MEAIVALVAIGAYVALLYWFATTVGPYVLALGGIALSGAVLVNYLGAIWATLFGAAGWEDSPHGPEPAFRQYFFRKAYRDYGVVVRDSFGKNVAVATWILGKVRWLFQHQMKPVTWPAAVMGLLIAGVGALAAVTTYAVLGAAHLALVLALAALVLVMALLSRAVESLSMMWRRIFLVCPHAGCYRRIGLPVYTCPGCGAEHRRLLPGSYGMFRRRCRCGQELATLFLLGRSKLPARCPHPGCQGPLNAAVGTARNLHVPVVGGPAAGKTSFLMANLVELHARAAGGELALDLPEKKDRLLFEACQRAFAAGEVVRKTAEYSPDAFLAKLTDTKGNRALLYIYDAAGELYQGADTLRSQVYYGYTHGLLVMLDGFSLPQVQRELGRELATAAAALKPSVERPQDIYDRMISKLREDPRNAKRARQLPVAVVITKTDALGLAERIRASGPGAEPDPISARSAAVREWLLQNGEGNFVRGVEHDFDQVRYFHCSALGRMPDGAGAPFRPSGALAPIVWLLGTYGVALRPDGA
jgi:hypothetical protein